ncbi:MAG: HD domain-containing protein [Defluviitaleaceae bacterium]|nr:HD domain-containing protein [Defluviitaleaceae bacterium]
MKKADKAESRGVYDIEKIFEVVLAFNSVNDRTELLNIILTKMMEITYSDAGTLYTVDDDKLNFRIIKNKTLGIFQSSETDEINLPPIILDKNNIQNVSAYSAIKNEIVLVDDVYAENERFNFSGPKKYDNMTGYSTRAMLVLPICTQRGNDNEVLGVIQMINPIDPITGGPGVYGNIYEPPIVPALAKIAANTLANLTYVRDLRLLLRSFAAVMTQAIDERSPYNNNHTQNVAQYCEKFATHLGRIFPQGHAFHFDSLHTERLVLAALLHDIGKIITPLSVMDKSDRLGQRLEAIRYRFELKKCQIEIDWLHKRINNEQYAVEKEMTADYQLLVEHINTIGFLTDEHMENVLKLRSLTYKNTEGAVVPLLDEGDIDALSIKKGTLTASEREIMQQHVVITGRLLDKIPFWKYYGDVPQWARSHHEFLDGTGYPQKLSGAEVPIESCIITIMDIFDALIDDDRPYKKGIPIDKSLKILEKMADEGKLHKELVQLFTESKLWEDIV